MTDFTNLKQPFDPAWIGSMLNRCPRVLTLAIALLAVLVTLASCGNVDEWVAGTDADDSVGGASGDTQPIDVSSYTVGGTVSGLQGSLVLQNNGTDDLLVDADGSITFAATIGNGQEYNVTVLSQPGSQTCTVSSGAGAVSQNNVNNVAVVCASNTFEVGGSVIGLLGSLVLLNNNTDSLTISADGSFSFGAGVAVASPYLVTIQTQPTGQSCSIVNGSGVIKSASVTNVAVNCVAGSHTVAGTITGLQGSAVLRNNGTDDLLVNSNGTFTFAAAVPYGSAYAVTEVWKQNARQTCTVINGAGAVNANVTNIELACVAHTTPRFAYVANYAGMSVSQFAIDANGALSAMSPATVAAGDTPVSMTTNPNGQNAYVVNTGDNTVSQYTIGVDGALSAMFPPTVATGSSPASVTVSPSGQYAYVANRTGSVSQFTVADNGALIAINPPLVASTGGPFAVTVDPSGQYAYVADGNDSVSQYLIGVNGALSPMSPATVPAGATPYSIVVDPSGRYAYVANLNGFSVSQYTIGSDGALTAMSPATVAAGPGSATITVDPGGRYAYVANSSGDSISQYSIGADGVLNAMSPSSVAVAGGPTAITVDPSGLYVYVANRQGNSLSQYAIDANGALSEMSPPAVSTGSYPYSAVTVGGP
jgi:6-phosphogluconolactonase (cycloisomerase 2 family)